MKILRTRTHSSATQPDRPCIPRAWWIGPWRYPDFQEAYRDLLAWGNVTEFEIDAASSRMVSSNDIRVEAERSPPQLVLLAQPRPGSLPPELADAVAHACPLARLVVLLGSWCEGEMRSGQPLHGVTRVFWHEWASRAPEQLEAIASGRPCVWSQPRTVAPAERGMLESQRDLPTSEGLILIDVDLRPAFEVLADACAGGGWSAVRFSGRGTVRGADLVLRDALRWDAREEEHVARLARDTGLPVVVLVGFPRGFEQREALAAGARGMLAKPCRQLDLLALLQRVHAQASGGMPSSAGRGVTEAA